MGVGNLISNAREEVRQLCDCELLRKCLLRLYRIPVAQVRFPKVHHWVFCHVGLLCRQHPVRLGDEILACEHEQDHQEERERASDIIRLLRR